MTPPAPVDYSNPAVERGITVRRLDDGTLEIDVPAAGLGRTLGRPGPGRVAVAVFLTACLLLPAGGWVVERVRTGQGVWLLAAAGSVALAAVIAGMVGVIVYDVGTRQTVLRCTADGLTVETTSRFQDGDRRHWRRDQITAVDVGTVADDDHGTRWVRVHLGRGVRPLVNGRTTAELERIAGDVRDCLSLPPRT